MTDPVRVRVAVTDADGGPAEFTAALRLAVGRTAATLTASGQGETTVSLPTGSLAGGAATLTVRATTAAGSRTVVLKRFVTVASGLELTGFGCTAVPRAGAAIAWAVSRMNGEVIAHPRTRDRWPRLPYTSSQAGLLLMEDATGAVVTTTGRMTLLSGTRTVATVPLASAARRLVFAVRWNGRVRGAFTPGVYTARIVLRDGAGRTITAEQRVDVVTAGTVPCG